MKKAEKNRFLCVLCKKIAPLVRCRKGLRTVRKRGFSIGIDRQRKFKGFHLLLVGLMFGGGKEDNPETCRPVRREDFQRSWGAVSNVSAKSSRLPLAILTVFIIAGL